MKIAVCLILVAYSTSVFSATLNAEGPITVNLKLIGTADGKSFFADISIWRTWFEAAEYCGEMGMRLADITTKAQADVLKAAYGPGFDDGFWTSGRDAHELRQFTWNTTGDAISNEHAYIGGVLNSLQYQTCVFYYSRSNSNLSGLYFTTCLYKMGVLCST